MGRSVMPTSWNDKKSMEKVMIQGLALMEKVMIQGLATLESGRCDGRFNRTPNPV